MWRRRRRPVWRCWGVLSEGRADCWSLTFAVVTGENGTGAGDSAGVMSGEGPMKQLLISVCVLLCSVAALVLASYFSVRPTGVSQVSADAVLAADDASKVPAQQLQYPAKDDPRLQGMLWIPGGVYTMGAADSFPDEFPPHSVQLDGFWMDETEVTNRQFAAFVQATGYVTLAEQPPKLRSVQSGAGVSDADILPDLNKPGSICSLQLSNRGDIDPSKGAYSWWQYVPGASWRHPEGPESSIDERQDHPVVHVSWPDAVAYCRWAGKELPTEAQWEYAARGGRAGEMYPWGQDRNPEGRWLHNIWQGEFPIEDTGADGFRRTAPVGSFPANAFGLRDISGNVWEWCADYYQPDYYEACVVQGGGRPLRNPRGPESSFDPQEPGIVKRVQRGGSFMCSDQYCIGYRTTARMKGEEDSGAFHTGFRCVINGRPVAVQPESSDRGH
jgi:sulfatase modifying factor 1